MISALRKQLGLTVFLSIGISIQSCDPFGCGCAKLEGKYFDIRGLSADNFKKRGTCCADKMSAGQEVSLNEYSLNLTYNISYFSAHPSPVRRAPFSLISQAYACDCIENGYMGSKEKLKRFTVLTMNDFDAQHKSNDTITDLLQTTIYPNTYDLSTYLKTDTASIIQRGYALTLKKAPLADFSAKIIIELQNGEKYTATTLPVKIR